MQSVARRSGALIDKGKPVVRRGRKARDLSEVAQPPKEHTLTACLRGARRLAALALALAATAAAAPAAHAADPGAVNFAKAAESSFDRFTQAPSTSQQSWMRSHYARMRTYAPYFDSRLGWYIVLGTIPIGIFGLVFHNQIESGARNLELIGTALILFSLVMLAADRQARQTRRIDDLNRSDGVFIGIAQALALVPGVSRSGATISAGLFRGLDRTSAARYSFLLSIPAVVLSGLFELPKIGDKGGAGTAPTIVATLLAFVVGYASIAFLLRYLARHDLMVFVVYRVVLGALVLVLAANGTIS